KLSALRFRDEFCYAGEDYLFWMEISKLTKKIAFSSACECICGEGLNVYSGSGWGSERSLERIHDETKYRKSVAARFELNREQRAFNLRKLEELRNGFTRSLLHNLTHGGGLRKGLLYSHLKTDPRFAFAFLPSALTICLSSIKSK